MRRLNALALLFLLLAAGCQTSSLHVREIAQPDYPTAARFENIQGRVRVEVAIGADGRVLEAKAYDADPLLIEAAEKNARRWVYGPFPEKAEFPIHHTVTYVYKLEGKPRVVDARVTVKTFLPSRIEISGVPLVSDYPTSDAHKAVPKTEK